MNHNTPVYSVFLDASKAFDKVNHHLLFKKLISRKVPMCFIRLLQFWYSKQTMFVKWGGLFSEPFNVSTGVRQGGVLSPYLFALYIDELSHSLNRVKAGCYIGNSSLNHILFADDLCCFCPSLDGLRKLLQVCYKYASSHDIVFNCKKSFGMLFSPKNFKLIHKPKLLIGNSHIRFVKTVKYLEVYLDSSLADDIDINRQVRSLYCTANKLETKFYKMLK